MFIQSEIVTEWLQRLDTHKAFFTEQAAYRDETRTFPAEQLHWLAEQGYSALTLPKQYGGHGLTVSDMVMLQEKLATFDSSTALAIGWQLGVVGDLFEQHTWDDATLMALATDIKNGALINRNASERATGSPMRGGRPETTAQQVGDTWVLNGHKVFATTSPVLRYFVVSAWVEEKQAVCHFLVPHDAEGLSLQQTWNTVGMRATASDDLLLHNVILPLHALVEVQQVPHTARINGWLLHIPACYLGIAQAARDYALHYATTYSPNSIQGTISDLPNVKTHIGHIEQELMEMRHFLYSAARLYDELQQRPFLTNELNAAKTKVMNGAIQVIDIAMRICGAHSLQMDCPLQRYYRDIRAGLHNPPMEDMVVLKLAETAITNAKK